MDKIILCVTGTLGFSILLNLPRKKIFIVLIGAFISAFIFETMCKNYTVFTSSLFASFSIGVYSEITARLFKTPSTVILIPCTIPLLPGSFLFYAMNYFVKGDYRLFNKYLLSTLYDCFGISLGIIITVTIVLTLRKLKTNIFTNR